MENVVNIEQELKNVKKEIKEIDAKISTLQYKKQELQTKQETLKSQQQLEKSTKLSKLDWNHGSFFPFLIFNPDFVYLKYFFFQKIFHGLPKLKAFLKVFSK